MAIAEEGGEHQRSSFDRDYWLRRCEGFQVVGPGGRIGEVRGIRFGPGAEPELLEVTAGLFVRRRLLIPVSEIAEVIPDQRRLTLGESPPLLADEPADQ